MVMIEVFSPTRPPMPLLAPVPMTLAVLKESLIVAKLTPARPPTLLLPVTAPVL